METKNIDEFAVSYKSSYQISPEDYAVVTPTLKVTRETTIGEVLGWFQGMNGDRDPMNVKIVQMMSNS